jgi:histidinol-phosphatase (PHP family)
MRERPRMRHKPYSSAMLATYHNHSNWSDGKPTLREMLDAARQMGIGELGVSDHWVLHPQGTIHKWAMHPDRLGEYVQALLDLREDATRQAGPTVRIGLEVDWFPHRPPPHAPDPGLPLRAVLDKHPFDYLIGSVHEVDGFMIDGSPAAWQPLSQDQINHLHRRYWQNMQSLGESRLFDIVAHIDLPKKFAFYPACDLSRDIGEALDAIAAAANRPVVEVNTAGWHKPCACAYPSLEILRECRKREIPVTISADAHQTGHLLRDFDKAAAHLREAGYTHVARFAGREKRFESLEEAMKIAPQS